ncbi:MAG: hypothetical protein JXA14_27195 [Anaerolineae bacterium]|nr:hypothetical protein [Anaerolineae bacterium]
MSSAASLRTVPSQQVLERLSMGDRIENLRIAGLLDLDPLVVSRWLCGEDMRGIYQPLVLHDCVLDGIDLEGRTFYEMVELVGCRISVAHFTQTYFYSILMIEDCIFEGAFHGRGIQNDGRVVIHNTVFSGWAEFEGLGLHGRADLMGVSFLGGTNLLHALDNNAHERLGHEILFRGCGFRAADVPDGLDVAKLGIVPLAEGGLYDKG